MQVRQTREIDQDALVCYLLKQIVNAYAIKKL